MSGYEELVERCGGGIVVRAILDEVFRTLETVTPGMERADMDLGGYGYGDACYEADPKAIYLAMLRVSPLAKPKEDAQK